MKNSEKIIFYFHGYGSSSATDKVTRLSEHFEHVYAPDLPAKYDEAYKVGVDFVLSKILDHLVGSDLKFFIVGTSLGGFIAHKVAQHFGMRAIIINPAWEPSKVLASLKADTEVVDSYEGEKISPMSTEDYFISVNDEVIEHTQDYLNKIDKKNIKRYGNSDHRFNGPEFDEVIEWIKVK